MKLLILAALVALSAIPSQAQTAEADSLLDVMFETAGYDRFLNMTHALNPPDPPGPIPRPGLVRAAWQELFTPAWYRETIQSRFLRDHSADDVRTMLAWLDDPVVLRAITHDYNAAAAYDQEQAERVRQAHAEGTLDARFVAASRRISAAAGDGLPMLEQLADYYVQYALYATEGVEGTPSATEIEALGDELVRGAKDAAAADMLQIILQRFEGYPLDDLEHYADALEAPGGLLYLELVTTTPSEVQAEALRFALGKARK